MCKRLPTSLKNRAMLRNCLLFYRVTGHHRMSHTKSLLHRGHLNRSCSSVYTEVTSTSHALLFTLRSSQQVMLFCLHRGHLNRSCSSFCTEFTSTGHALLFTWTLPQVMHLFLLHRSHNYPSHTNPLAQMSPKPSHVYSFCMEAITACHTPNPYAEKSQ